MTNPDDFKRALVDAADKAVILANAVCSILASQLVQEDETPDAPQSPPLWEDDAAIARGLKVWDERGWFHWVGPQGKAEALRAALKAALEGA